MDHGSGQRESRCGGSGWVCMFYSKVKLAKKLSYIFSNLDSSYKSVYVAGTKERYSHEQWLNKGWEQRLPGFGSMRIKGRRPAGLLSRCRLSYGSVTGLDR